MSRQADVEQIEMAVAISDAGIPFDAIDGRPVHILFAVLGPKNSAPEDHLQVLRWVSGLARNADFRRFAQSAGTEDALRDLLMESEYFEIMNETQRIPVVARTLKEKNGNFNEFDVSFKVREKGWVLSAYTMPPNAEMINSLRIVVRPHLNRTVIRQLAQDVIEACDYLKQHGGTATPPALHKHSTHKC